MVTIAITAEPAGKSRFALSPETAKKLVSGGARVIVESGAGTRSHFSDAAFQAQGAEIVNGGASAINGADILLKVRRPAMEELTALKPGTIVAAMLDPYSDRAELEAAAETGATLFSMEFMPRITRAQSMDVLSSQANLAGYKAVIDAAAAFGQALPMMMTAAGTVPATRVFIMGVGVAGLQAIATARRLGAIVTATDVRPATKEQVLSLGAKFVAVEDEEFRQARDCCRLCKADVGRLPEEAGRAGGEPHQRPGHRHHYGADPGAARAEADHAGHDREHEARLRDRRSRGGARRQHPS